MFFYQLAKDLPYIITNNEKKNVEDALRSTRMQAEILVSNF